MNNLPSTQTPKTNERQLVLIIYALYGAGYFLGGLPTLVAIFINYIKRSDIQDPVFISHFTWQIRTFWISFGIAVIGAITSFFFIGLFILVAAAIWNIYRLVRGTLAALDNKPMPISN